VLDATYRQIPLRLLKDARLFFRASKAYALCGDTARSKAMMTQVQQVVGQQLEYYYTMSPRMRGYIPYTLTPLLALQDSIFGK